MAPTHSWPQHWHWLLAPAPARALDAPVVEAGVGVSGLIELCWPSNVAVGIVARDKAELEATDTGADVDVVVVQLLVPVVVGLEALVQVEYVGRNVVVARSVTERRRPPSEQTSVVRASDGRDRRLFPFSSAAITTYSLSIPSKEL